MKLTQAVKMALKSILGKKGRSFLTMLGIIIGIASVMTIVSVVSGQNQKMLDYYAAMGTNRITCYGGLYNGESMFEKVYAYCQSLDELVVGVTPEVQCGNNVRYGVKNTASMDWEDQPRVILGSSQYAVCNNFALAKGRDLTELDVEEYHRVCVLGARAARVLFDYTDPVGETLTVDGVPFTVLGVYREKDPDNSYSPDNVIILPYTAGRFLNAGMEWAEFTVKAKDAAAVPRVMALLRDYMNGLTQDGQTGYGDCYSTQQWQEQENEQTRMMSLVLGGIAGISLLVGGIGIMNIMLVTVTERTREIGIRRAIGAERSSIVLQFLVEAAMICGIGGILGIALGFLATQLAGKLILDGLSLLPDLRITLGAFGFSVVLGLLFGMYPAIKASGLPPVAALRAE